ncbi:MAG: hypothetical protein ACRD0A_06910, partial [Acidimicrobiales bacterium]
MTLRHATTAVGLVLGSLVLASPAEAGGSWPSPVKDRYEPGEVVTIVGYTGVTPAGQYYGWLRVDPDAAYDPHPPPAWPFVHETDLRVGNVVIERTAHGGWATWRASLSFPLPADLTTGEYEVVFCNDPCTQGLGDVVGAVIHVGVDPPNPPVRDWPLDDPAIALLEPDAKLWYSVAGVSSHTVTAAQVLAGNLPDPAELRPQLDDIRDVSIDDTTTTVAPAPPDEDDADLRLTDDDDASGSSGASTPSATPWIAAAVGAVLLFIAVQAFGPGRKQVQHGPQRSTTPR